MQAQTGDVRFGRSAFGGFNRQDVMDYIDKLQRSVAQERDDPDALAKIRRECDELAREIRRLREENANLRAQLDAGQTAQTAPVEKQSAAESDESFSATAETVRDDVKRLSLRDVDEMVQKYFG